VNFDWQWTDVIAPAHAPVARALNLDRLPPALQPIVQPIDDWNRNYKLGLVFECRVGTGRLMVCAADLETALDARPAARQLRKSLLDYMAGPKFQPQIAVAPSTLGSLLFDTSIMHKLSATVTADGQPADALVDGDPNTTWQSAAGTDYPHIISVTFPALVSVSGLALMPQQNDMHHNGDIRQYTVEASDDGATWRPVTAGEIPSTFEPQRVAFPKTIKIRYLRLTALSGYPNWDARSLSSVPSTTAALGDLAVVYAGPKLPDMGTGVIDYQHVQTATPEIDEGAAATPKR
jgi:beta-galactosidase